MNPNVCIRELKTCYVITRGLMHSASHAVTSCWIPPLYVIGSVTASMPGVTSRNFLEVGGVELPPPFAVMLKCQDVIHDACAFPLVARHCILPSLRLPSLLSLVGDVIFIFPHNIPGIVVAKVQLLRCSC